MKKKKKKLDAFTFSLFIAQWIAFSTFAFIWLQIHPVALPTLTGFLYVDLLIFFFTFFNLKYFLQKGIIHVFSIKNFGKKYQFCRIAYASYAILFTVLLTFIVLYSLKINNTHFIVLSFILLIINAIGLISFIKVYQKTVKQYLHYFILYLCTFEFAPYVLVLYGLKFL